MTIQQLQCEAGNHTWERIGQRGKKPKSCPDHTPPKFIKPPKPTPIKVIQPVIEESPKVDDDEIIRARSEAYRQVQLEKAEARIDNLMMMLASRNMLLSQSGNREIFKGEITNA